MFWIILVSLIMFVIMWLLIAPIYLRIIWTDTYQLFQLEWLGVFRASLLPITDEWYFQIRVLCFQKKWPIFNWLFQPAKPSQSKTKKKKKRQSKHPMQMARRIWRSFRLIRFQMNIDLDDYVLNAYLFPLFLLANRKKKLEWNINFNGKNELLLITENRLSRLLYAFFS